MRKRVFAALLPALLVGMLLGVAPAFADEVTADTANDDAAVLTDDPAADAAGEVAAAGDADAAGDDFAVVAFESDSDFDEAASALDATIAAGETKTEYLALGQTALFSFTPQVFGTYTFTISDAYNVCWDIAMRSGGAVSPYYQEDGNGNLLITCTLVKGQQYVLSVQRTGGYQGSVTVSLSTATPLRGWQEIADRIYYFGDNGEPLTGLQTIEGERYLFNSAGHAETGFVSKGGYYYYFGGSGKMLTSSWKKVAGYYRYFGADGKMKVSRSLKLGGYTYYVDSKGRMVTGLKKIGSYYYYFTSQGRMVTGGYKVPGKGVCLFSDKGRMITGDGWKNVLGKRYYLKSSRALTSWRKIGGYWYYFDAKGRMAVGWKKISGANSYFYGNGHCAVGRVTGLTTPKSDSKAVGAITWRYSWKAVSGARGYQTNQANKYYNYSAGKYDPWQASSGYLDMGKSRAGSIATQHTVLMKQRVRAYTYVNGKRAYGPWSTWTKVVGFGKDGKRFG